MNIYYLIEQLIAYGIKNHLIFSLDKIIVKNQLMEIFKLENWEDIDETPHIEKIHIILNNLCDYAAKLNIIEDGIISRDLFDTKLMRVLTPSQNIVNQKFSDIIKKTSIQKATKWYYEFSKATNYIRKDRIDKNIHWMSMTEYGNMEITINLSKPEKDPADIAREKNAPQLSYPKCLLCYENVGYGGRVNHVARQNHRVIEVKISEDKYEKWYLQHSPYIYYNEHAIVFSVHHRPMKIDIKTFERLLSFIKGFPHYFIGSNGDLPIVGGSILSHDHYQGGNHQFPMANAKIETKIIFKGYETIKAGIIKWPISVIRLKSSNRKNLVSLSNKILECWQEYSDEKNNIMAFTDKIPHNTITPIARKIGSHFEMDLALRNNRTTEEFPLGIFHPHEEVHNIKKENIGLIEVMGLAVLPGRLKEELEILENYIILNSWEEIQKRIATDDRVIKHLEWSEKIHSNYKYITKNNAKKILKTEVGNVFSKVLEHAGVFKRDQNGKEAFLKFIEYINNK